MSAYRRSAAALGATVLGWLVGGCPAFAQIFNKQVIYQVVTDRFFDGDASNDNPSDSPGLFDPRHADWRAYWGGDLAGIQQKLAYIQGLGATAIWISPPVDNENLNMSSSGPVSAPYHGYHARDFMRVEEHFGDNAHTWAAFDGLVSAAHQDGIKIIADWANNHTNDSGDGEHGALYNNGAFMASAADDPNGYFHHNPDISDYDDRYQLQYYTLSGLADLNQENPVIDSYLKTAAMLFQRHGVDAFRLDAIKHATWGWEYSFANALFNNRPTFLFGEWMNNSPSDVLYRDAYKFANRSGISELDFGVNWGMRDVFAGNKGFQELDGIIAAENTNFSFPNSLATFFDSHDESRLLTMNPNQDRLHEAIAFLLTCRGVPILLYGDEQYLHNDTNNGNDPYDRVMMTSFDTGTTAYKLIARLAALRQSNDALGYGTWRQRWLNNDVYIYERQFFGNVVLVAVNKNDTTAQEIGGLYTALPAGGYSDVLGGLLGGQRLTVTAGGTNNNVAGALKLPPHSVSVWQVAEAATAPEIGAIAPWVAQPGAQIALGGDGFGATAGTVTINGVAAPVTSWSNTNVTFTVPSVPGGVYTVQLANARGAAANPIQLTVLTAKLVPVTFTVNQAAPTRPGDFIFLTGDTVELGKWATTFDAAVGPMLAPNYPNWFLNASMPAGQTIQFKFIKIAADGTVTWEGGANHAYKVPASGTGAVNVNWQY